MKRLEAAYKADTRGWRGLITLALAPAIAYGIPAALLAQARIGVGDPHMPVLPSGIALAVLLVLGWKALPGIVTGAWAAALVSSMSGAGIDEMGTLAWLVFVPSGACMQAAVSYGLARRVAPELFDTTSPWELGRFLFTCGPLGSALGACVLGIAATVGHDPKWISLLMSCAAWWVVDIFSCLALVAFVLGFLSRSQRPFLLLAMVGAATVLLLGTAVVSGWLSHDAVLIQVLPELTPMQFNTAASFVFCGASLLILIQGFPRVAGVVAGVPCLVGMLTLAQYVFAVNLHIDELLLKHYITTNTAFPGRMAPSTALCFVLFGIAVSQSARTTRGSHVAASTLYSIVASVGLTALLSYLAGVGSAFTWAAMTPMAIHTATGFVLLGLGGLAREVVQVEGATRRVSLSPIPTGVALVATTIWVWQAVYHDEQEKIRNLARERAIDISRIIDMEVTYHNNAQSRMAERWSVGGGTSKEIWTADARSNLRDFPTVAAIAWADSESQVRWLEPIEGNEEIIGFKLNSHPQGEATLLRIRETGKQASTDVIAISRIGLGFIVFSPIHGKTGIEGYIAALYRIDRLFDVLSPNAMKNYMFRVLEKEKVVFSSNPDQNWPDTPDGSIQVDRIMRDGLWTLQLVPQPGWLATQRSNVPLLILFAGLFLSAATTIALFLLEAVRAQFDTIHMSESRLRQLVDCAPTGLISIDANGIMVDVNPEARKQFGYTTEEMLGHPIDMLIPGHLREAYRQERRAFNQQPRSQSIGKDKRLAALRKDGREFPVEVALAPFQTREGPRVLALVTDITERDEARRKLEDYTRALELINKDLDDFAYVASHDLRAPLTAIASLVLWIEEDTAGSLSVSSSNHLALIKNRVARMGKLLEDLLDYSRAGRSASHLEAVDTGELVMQVTDLVRNTSPVAVTCTGLPVLYTVRTPLQQVFRNLISNAIKHHDGDVCTIEITALEAGGHYIFRIKDDGPGIPAQFRERVFNMFQTLRPRDEVEGSGMGLALVRKLVERYGGVVKVVESEGRGATIEFTWPKITMGD